MTGSNHNGDLLKIGDFAKLADTNLRTLRYYEELGLLQPATRSRGGFRYYRRTDLNRLNMIRDLQELGLHLDRIRELMATRDSAGNRSEFIGRVREALGEQDRLLAQRIETLTVQRERIRSALGKIHECEHCRHMPSRAEQLLRAVRDHGTAAAGHRQRAVLASCPGGSPANFRGRSDPAAAREAARSSAVSARPRGTRAGRRERPPADRAPGPPRRASPHPPPQPTLSPGGPADRPPAGR